MEISNDNMDIILEKATTGYNEWFLPNCSLDTGSENKLIGNNRFNVTVSNKISEKKSSGGDYEIIYIPSQAGNKSENKNDYLIFMEGSSASSGLPSWAKSLEIIHDRNVTYENEGKTDNGLPYSSIVDIKARSKDGYLSRFIGHAFEIIYYDDVSEETANKFDSILDSLCITYPMTPK